MTLVILETEEEEINHGRCVPGQSDLTGKPHGNRSLKSSPEVGGDFRAKLGLRQAGCKAIVSSCHSMGTPALWPLTDLDQALAGPWLPALVLPLTRCH